MSRRKWYVALVGLVVVVTAVTLGLVFGFTSGQPQSTQGTLASLQSAEGPKEGIQVHGHWTIDVLNPDGTLAEHREFENALAGSTASTMLCDILGRLNCAAGWTIDLSGTTGGANSAFRFSKTMIYESSSPTNLDTDLGYFKTLTVSVPTSGDNNGKLVLSGTATAYQDGQFNTVTTTITEESNQDLPAPVYWHGTTDLSHWMVPFTVKTLSDPISLSAGQEVLVTVVISFS